MYNPVTHQFYVSRHVVFDENTFYFQKVSHSSQPIFTVPDHTCSDTTEYSHTPLADFSTLDANNSDYTSPITQHHSLNDYVPVLPDSSTHESLVSPTSVVSSSPDPPPAQRISLRNKIKPIWMKDYITTDKPVTCSSNTLLLDCPISSEKFNFSHYSAPTSIYACVVSPATTIPEPYTYAQAIKIIVGLKQWTKN